MHQYDVAEAVNHYRGRIGSQTHHLLPKRIYLRHRECQPQFLLESSDSRLIGIHRVHCQNLDLILVLFISFLHKGELHLAGNTFQVPEVQNHGLLGLEQLRKGILHPFCVGDGKIHHQIAQLVGQVLHILFRHHACTEDDLGECLANGIALRHCIACRHIAQHCHIGSGRSGEKHFSFGIGLIKPYQFRQSLILIDIDAHSL